MRIAELYADGALFRTSPFGSPMTAAEHAAALFGAEEIGGDVRFGEPAAHGDDRAAVEWWSVVRLPEGGTTTFAGVSLLRFDGSGHVLEERAYWHAVDGRREPHESWGR
jgi:hypothetical protein